MTYTISTGWAITLILLAVWDLAWKGVALWRAGNNRQAYWFTVLLILNTAGLLPIFYLKFGQKQTIFRRQFPH